MGDGSLKKSHKLLLGIALGIPIVTDSWLNDSFKQSRLLDIKPYVPPTLEDIWGKPQKDLLQGIAVYFTPSLKKTYVPFTEITEVCKAVGARKTFSKPAEDLTSKEFDGVILLALNEADPDVATLVGKGQTCYSKDMLSNSILRGKFDFESDEFKLGHLVDSDSEEIKVETPKKRGKPRRSLPGRSKK